MSTTALEVRQPPAGGMPAKIAYAHELAASGLLPAAFRKNPANVLWAMEYADMLGLPAMVAMTGIHVIDGKPTASAGLISGLVRKAKHRLRVTGDGKHAIAEITRRDDPKFVFRSEWTLDRARQAELLDKANWKKYPAAMLKARAITEVARDACEEALFGLQYTPEELGAEGEYDGSILGEVITEDPGPDFPPCDDDAPQNGNGRRWADEAIAQAASFKTEAEGQKLWRESAAAVLDGRATPGEATHIQNLINARVADRRREAALKILEDVPDDDEWRDLILGGLASDGDARNTLGELQRLADSGQIGLDRGQLLTRAILALFPKAGIRPGESDG